MCSAEQWIRCVCSVIPAPFENQLNCCAIRKLDDDDNDDNNNVKFFRSFRNLLRPHLQGVAGGLVEPKLKAMCPTLCCVCLRWVWVRDLSSYQFWFCQATRKTLKMGTGSVHETPENLHNLTRLSAREHFIDFCRRENFKTYITFWHLVVFQSCYTSLKI
jgi:hypothetical protein